MPLCCLYGPGTHPLGGWHKGSLSLVEGFAQLLVFEHFPSPMFLDH